MNFSIFTKPICRFLIHRYMGQYLKTEISSDQLEFRLADGTACVQKVTLNTEYINEILDPIGVVSLVEGFVEEISACVPWKKLMTESTVIKIDGLQLTLTPLADINMANTQDLVSSMIGSIASSMDLARSMIADEQMVADGAESAGVEQFASLIDQVISRIKVIFENLTIRVEAYSEMCTGLEIQIDRMEFHDEQLEARQQSAGAGEAVTTQPSSLYTVTDLNKLLHVQGVRLYTDVWTRDSLAIDRLTGSRTNSSEDEAEPMMSNSTSANFQSCYSHFTSRTAKQACSVVGSTQPPTNCIPPNPVLFAQLFTEARHTVRVRVNNTALSSCNENSVYNKRVDIDIFVAGSMYALLTPSQIALLRDLFSRLMPKMKVECTNAAAAYGGLPMREEHFQKLTDQFVHGEAAMGGGGGGLRGSAFSNFPFSNRSTWSGAEQFYELLPQLNPANKSSADYPNKIPPAPASMQRSSSLESTISKDQKSNASTTTLVERRPDVFTLALRVPTLVLAITHDDPLGVENIRRLREEEGSVEPVESHLSIIRNVCNKMSNRANDFFSKAMSIKLAKRQLDEQRGVLSGLLNTDHLRLTTNGSVLALTLVNEHIRNSLQLEGSFEECDFIECLLPSSIKGATACENVQYFDLLNLSNRKGIASKDVFTFRMNNSLEKQHEYTVEFNMERCKTDVDISIVDRIAHLLVAKPSFFPNTYHSPSHGGSGRTGEDHKDLGPFGGLRDNFLSTVAHNEPPSTYTFKFYISEWTVDFRIPIADFSPASVRDCSKKNVHGEHLHAVIDGATIRIPKITLSNRPQCGELIVEGAKVVCSFIGDPLVMACSDGEMKFLYASSTDGNMDKRVRLHLSYASLDTRNKSLRTQNITSTNSTSINTGLMAKSMFESIFKPREEDKIEGPFSKTSSYFADTRLIMAGSRVELEEFSEECRSQSKMNVELSIPKLNVLLPSHKFVELLYNRLANDLALWEPKCPLFRESKSASIAGQAPPATLFRPFSSCDDKSSRRSGEVDNEEDDDSTLHSSNRLIPKSRRKHRSPLLPSTSSHQLSLTLQVGMANLLLQTVEAHPKLGLFKSQIGHEMSNAEMFLVYGFQENANLSYLYATSTKASICHRNLLNGILPMCSEVESKDFSKGRKDDVQAEPISSHSEPSSLVKDDNVAVCLKLLLHPDANIKDVLVAVALRNTLVHIRPLTDAKLFWLSHLVDFLTLIDYEIPGYEMPIVKIDLHVHLTSLLVGYNHSVVVPHSPMQLRLEIGSCDLTAQLMQEMERFKFNCLLEDAKLWLRKGGKERVSFEPFSVDPSKSSSFVKCAMIGLMHFLVAYTVSADESSNEPMLELTCVNDVIKMWLCSDTVVELLNMAVEFFQSDMGTLLFSSRPPTPTDSDDATATGRKNELLMDMVNKSNVMSASVYIPSSAVRRHQKPALQRELSVEERDRLMEMMASAMEDDPQAMMLSEAIKSRRSGRKGGNSGEGDLQQIAEIFSEELGEEASSDVDLSSASTTTNTDDEFIMVEKIPSASFGVTRMSKNRLDPDFEIIQTPYRIPPDVETGLTSEDLNNESNQLQSFDHPPAILRYSINDISLCIYLYGGSDFGDFPSRPQKTYSQWDTHRESGECADARRESEGGKFRDHTVCVELKVSKMSLLCEVFNAAAPVLSLNILKINDVDVVDRVMSWRG